jgi:hypothetical protein
LFLQPSSINVTLRDDPAIYLYVLRLAYFLSKLGFVNRDDWGRRILKDQPWSSHTKEFADAVVC